MLIMEEMASGLARISNEEEHKLPCSHTNHEDIRNA